MSNLLIKAKYKLKRELASNNWEKKYLAALSKKSGVAGHELKLRELAAFRNYWVDRAMNLRDRHVFIPDGFKATTEVAVADVVTMRDRTSGKANVVFSTMPTADATAIKAHEAMTEGLDYIGWKLAQDGEGFGIVEAMRLPEAKGYNLADEDLWKKVTANLDKSYDVKVRSFFEIHSEADPADYPRLLKEWYKAYVGKDLNLEKPETFNEKIQWLKLYGATEEKSRLADKYEVREFVKERIGEDYLINLIGVYDRAEEIPYDELPQKFVIKATHGCHFNIVVTDKSKLNIEKTNKTLNKWLDMDFGMKFLEVHYTNIKPRLVVEEYLENADEELFDYKVFCFEGKPEYIQFIFDRESGKRMAFFDRDWNKQGFISNGTMVEEDLPRPERLEELLELCEKLADGFNFVRVDFYILNDGTLKFGEMTFTPGTGALNWNPPEYDKFFGDKIILPTDK